MVEHLYNGEVVDGAAAAGLAGWCEPGFVPGQAWTPAAARPSPTASLSVHSMLPITSWEDGPRRPVALTQLQPNSWLFDMGINGAALCTLSLPPPLPAGAFVKLTFAETLGKDGGALVGFRCPSACCADGGNCANQTYTYITSGAGGVERFTPTFAYPAFRWVQVEGWPQGSPAPTADALACTATSTGAAVTGGVFFNDTVLDGLQRMVVNTQRSNFHSIPTDCPCVAFLLSCARASRPTPLTLSAPLS